MMNEKVCRVVCEGFIHLCGVGLLMIPFVLSDFVFQTALMDWVETYHGIYVSSFAAILLVALAIRDGQFIDEVKDSQWSKRKNER